jgi:Lrp/AsnC family transcriptional regulator for asnA, asnC and gidA
MPFVKIAEILKIAEVTVRRKVNKLIEDGIIKMTAICDPHAIGFDAPAFVGLDVERRQLTSVAKKITQMPEVQFAAITTGPYDITIQVVSLSNRKLYAFIMELGNIEGVKDTETHLILEIYKQTWDLEAITKKNDTLDEELGG